MANEVGPGLTENSKLKLVYRIHDDKLTGKNGATVTDFNGTPDVKFNFTVNPADGEPFGKQFAVRVNMAKKGKYVNS